MGGVRGRDDVLFDHQRAEVVASEPQRDLADLHSHRHPAGLKIRNVVEHDARERDSAQIFGRRRSLAGATSSACSPAGAASR